MLAPSRSFHAIRQSNLVATPSTSQWGTRLTAHANPHEKGAYAALMTATYDINGFSLGLAASAASATQTDMMLDLAIGAAQENIIVPEYLCGWKTTVASGASWHHFDIAIPKGTLISGRIQALITVDTLDVLMFANGGASGLSSAPYAGCDAIGTVVAASQGTSHTPGDSGAESTAADIGSPTARAYRAIMLSQNGTLANTTMTAMAYHWELLIGAVVVCEWYAQANAAEFVVGPFPSRPFPCSIPAGTQLQLRAEGGAASAQAQDVALYGFW